MLLHEHIITNKTLKANGMHLSVIFYQTFIRNSLKNTSKPVSVKLSISTRPEVSLPLEETGKVSIYHESDRLSQFYFMFAQSNASYRYMKTNTLG